MIYRLKQFYWGIIAKISSEDIKFIREYLDDRELKLFNRLSIYEQAHCIRTAKAVNNIYFHNKIDSNILIKVALLHDIGKIKKRLNLIDKSILVILDKLTRGKIRKFNNIKRVDVYYNHGDKGYEILKDYNYNDRFLYLVKNHHNNIIGDKGLDILKECDSKS